MRWVGSYPPGGPAEWLADGHVTCRQQPRSSYNANTVGRRSRVAMAMIVHGEQPPRALRLWIMQSFDFGSKAVMARSICCASLMPNGRNAAAWMAPNWAGAGWRLLEPCRRRCVILPYRCASASLRIEITVFSWFKPNRQRDNIRKDRKYLERSSATAPECNVTMPCDFSSTQMRHGRFSSPAREQYRRRHPSIPDHAGAEVSGGRGQVVAGRPAGCPRSFCGCGTSIRVFGRIVPSLNLASHWLRFPRTSPAPGMVAARRGHVFVLEQHLGGDMWMAYDANSGGRATRIHARSLRGYTVVNPRAA
jgi:hypothetical protein